MYVVGTTTSCFGGEGMKILASSDLKLPCLFNDLDSLKELVKYRRLL